MCVDKAESIINIEVDMYASLNIDTCYKIDSCGNSTNVLET